MGGIPKRLHYCWFGGGKMPAVAAKCIESWRRYAPDFTITEWNERNFDLNALPFTRDAYADKRYAFVSDYARAKMLSEQGGVYLDIDMELLRPLDEFLGAELFAGFEAGGYVACGIIGSVPGHPLWEGYLRHFEETPYWGTDGRHYSESCVPLFSALLDARGLRREDCRQDFDGIAVYPSETFYPLDYRDGTMRAGADSAALHHYAASWLPWHVRAKAWAKRKALGVVRG